MFEFVRTHTKLLLFVLVILIIPSFVFFGVQGYTQFNDPSNRTVASVDGRKITQREWDAAHQRRIEQVRRQVPGIDARLLDSPEFKRETLDALVRDEVLRRAAEKLHLATTDERLQRSFLNDPQLAFLRQADGRINRDLLAAQGMSVEQFESRLRYDLTIQQVLDGVANSATPAALPARTALNALLERREVQVQTFAASDYATTVRPSDDDIAAYYNDPANQAQFRAPEQARIEYVVLDLQALARGITVPEEDLRKYYEENAARYTQAEERRASHILVKADRSASADERAKAKAKAESLLAQARANPQQFAALAKAHSDDPGSAAQGGDLDWFGRGAMVKPFEDAVFAMKPGEISPLVETDFGYHIIRLDAVRGGERRPFDSVRAEITEEVRRQLALRKYAEAAEQFSNTVYEQPDSLQPVADKLGLEVRTATVQRTPAPGASGALASASLLEAVFAEASLRTRRNTEAIEVGANQLASARVLEHQPQRVRPLDEVRDQVRARVVAQQAAALARKDGEARLAAVRGGDTTGLPAPVVLSRDNPRGQPREVVDAVLRADAASLPAVFGVDLGERGYAVVRLNAVQPPANDLPQLAQLQPRYAQAWAAAEAQAYYDALKRRLRAEVRSDVKAP
ncbi:SurA N-terminal domain-containing protein [Calidifontimicrobium sp. SYSU G02091]|uniref:SurA N-terminal domain-containing protein n=1 Tax=Calidifontimicrobium sp. SYSU G02091 TaxID=2926421 RepID=UPI001F5330B4|nr:SurA N-terminal domain-containing protein [Calidifontimicrobium sp. SYSU G02091]MCI1192744.1 SurA N-terminal domain-containing protein [Calidifontimicrobium sp. SYSU G02091]